MHVHVSSDGPGLDDNEERDYSTPTVVWLKKSQFSNCGFRARSYDPSYDKEFLSLITAISPSRISISSFRLNQVYEEQNLNLKWSFVF